MVIGSHRGGISDVAMAQICKLVSCEYSSLESLSLATSSMDNTLPIIRALKDDRKIKEIALLVLTGPQSPRKNVETAFLATMVENTVLETIKLRHQDASSDHKWRNSEIDFYLKLNRQAHRSHLLESGTATDYDWVDAIVENRDDHPVVHFLLSKNPSLCNIQA